MRALITCSNFYGSLPTWDDTKLCTIVQKTVKNDDLQRQNSEFSWKFHRFTIFKNNRCSSNLVHKPKCSFRLNFSTFSFWTKNLRPSNLKIQIIRRKSLFDYILSGFVYPFLYIFICILSDFKLNVDLPKIRFFLYLQVNFWWWNFIFFSLFKLSWIDKEQYEVIFFWFYIKILDEYFL